MELSDIIKKRTAPGILIFDMENRLSYSNNQAFAMFPCLREGRLPDAITELCNGARNGNTDSRIVQNDKGIFLSLRAFLIGWKESEKGSSHMLVMIEGIIKKRQIDFTKAWEDFDLTKRELEVLQLICNGLTNREISKELAIGEYTVKDHLKNIMRKMNVKSRGKIITRLQ